MKEIDWGEVADEYQLTPSEFVDQLFTASCAVAMVDIDTKDIAGVKFTCADDVGKIELTVRRVEG